MSESVSGQKTKSEAIMRPNLAQPTTMSQCYDLQSRAKCRSLYTRSLVKSRHMASLPVLTHKALLCDPTNSGHTISKYKLIMINRNLLLKDLCKVRV